MSARRINLGGEHKKKDRYWALDFEFHVVVCCNLLQCVAVCCRLSQGVAVCCCVLLCSAVFCRVLQHVAACSSVRCSVLQCMLHCVAVYVVMCCSQHAICVHAMM